MSRFQYFPQSRHGSLFHAALFGLLAVTLACGTDPDVVDPSGFEEIYVFGVLSPSASSQEIHVTKTQAQALPLPITNARVTIRGPLGEVQLAHDSAGYYRATAQQLQIEPSTTYYLRVQINGHDEISASARVPSSFRILHPQPGDTIVAKRRTDYDVTLSYSTIYSKRSGGWLTWVQDYYDVVGLPYYAFTKYCLTNIDTTFMGPSLYLERNRVVRFVLVRAVYCDTLLTTHATLTRAGICFDAAEYSALVEERNDFYNRHPYPYNDYGTIKNAKGLFAAAVADSVKFYLRVED